MPTNESGKEQRKVPRIHLDATIPVTLSSIGSEVKYKTETSNLSANGIFLDFEKPGRFPFTENSILEVWLHADPKEEPIFFNGKLSRIVSETTENENNHPGIAIRMIQIEAEQEKRLGAFLASKAPAKQA